MSTTSMALSYPGISFSGFGSDEPVGIDAARPPWETQSLSTATNRGVSILEPPQEASRVFLIPAGFKTGLLQTLRSIDAVANEPEEDDDYGPARPTDFARRSAVKLVGRAASLLDSLPAGSACTDGVGGIRITWRNEIREIRLVLAPTPQGRSYLYMQAGEESRITEDTSENMVATSLRWLEQSAE